MGRRIAALCLLVAGCATGADHALPWRVRFVDSISRARTVHVDLYIQRGACGGEGDVVYAEGTTQDGDPSMPSDLEPGVYAFTAVARDRACNVVASVCTGVSVPAQDPAGVVLGLGGGEIDVSCTRCTTRCLPSADLDAAIDAPVITRDAAIDATLDADAMRPDADAAIPDASIPDADAMPDAFSGDPDEPVCMEFVGPLPGCPELHKNAFVTSTIYNGGFGGLDAADSICQSLASDAALPGEYRAWLSTSTVDARDRFTDTTSTYCSTGGSLLGGIGNFQGSQPYYLIRSNQYGASTEGIYWTGTIRSGRWSHYSCGDWLSVSPAQVGTCGDNQMSACAWTSAERLDCASAAHLLCVQR